MSDDNSMDVDDVPKTLLHPISLSQSSPVSSSSLPLPQAEVDKFKKDMILASKRECWSSRLIGAGSDKEQLQNVLFSVLSSCGRIVLSQATLQKNLIDLSNSENIDKLVRSLNDDEVEELRNIVQKGDWVGLIMHPKLRKSAQDLIVDRRLEKNLHEYNERLGKAYTQQFIGDFATEFIKHIKRAVHSSKGRLKGRQVTRTFCKQVFIISNVEVQHCPAGPTSKILCCVPE